MPRTATQRTARDELHDRYRSRIRTDPALHRRLVSFRGNRDAAGFGWLAYKEAFSAALARDVIEQHTTPGQTVLDPFAGVGTACFAARALGRRAIGIELLPVGVFAMEARRSAEAVTPAAFRRRVNAARGLDWGALADPAHALAHIPITRGAFPAETERAIAGFRAFCERRIRDPHARRLFHLACLGVLEAVSFTRKDGQYLRWDARAARPGIGTRFRKRRIAPFGEAIGRRLASLCADLEQDTPPGVPAMPVDLRQGSCLELLPALDGGSVDLVLTSPPYCNRYDYTRTYALELVYLGLDAPRLKRLRQAMLSCTVENVGKDDGLGALYRAAGRAEDFARARDAFGGQAALREVLEFLEGERRGGRLNNPNIPRLVRNYFFEMSVVIFELARVLRPGGRVVMVNDNVRYAGREVPVDLILSDLAARAGLRVEAIRALARGKGNSSQQMGAHGRSELRKCVYEWVK